jgi:hypothetical protein
MPGLLKHLLTITAKKPMIPSLKVENQVFQPYWLVGAIAMKNTTTRAI